jgi:hypothetical protein
MMQAADLRDGDAAPLPSAWVSAEVASETSRRPAVPAPTPWRSVIVLVKWILS